MRRAGAGPAAGPMMQERSFPSLTPTRQSPGWSSTSGPPCLQRAAGAIERGEADRERHERLGLAAPAGGEGDDQIERGIERQCIGDLLPVDAAAEGMGQGFVEDGLEVGVDDLRGHARAGGDARKSRGGALPAGDHEDVGRLGDGRQIVHRGGLRGGDRHGRLRGAVTGATGLSRAAHGARRGRPRAGRFRARAVLRMGRRYTVRAPRSHRRSGAEHAFDAPSTPGASGAP